MTHSENTGDTLLLSKECSPLSDEVCCSGSPTLHEQPAMKKGPWTSAEDALLIKYVKEHGEGNWNAVQIESALLRCGKSCRLRWANHLRPHLKKGSFSQEEEQLIVKLHFEMGNKWAHMATLLPGRTDNEIKNYWNTRVKRRQRAGLPLYPDDFSVPESDENKLVRNTSELNSADKQNSAVSLERMPVMLDFKFDYYKNNPCPLPYVAALVPDIPDTNIPAYGLGSYMQNSGIGHVKQSGVPEISLPDCLINLPNFTYDPIYLNPGLICPSDTDPWNKNLASFSCSIPGNTVPSNNNSSSRPLPGALKMELPSLQYLETDYVDWNTSSSFSFSYDDVDSYIQSPGDISLQSDCDSSINNGLLEDLVYESRAVNCGKKRFFEEISGDAFTPGTIDPNSPFCRSAASLFNECNPNIGNQFDEFSSFETPLGLEETMLNTSEISTLFGPFEDLEDIPDLSRPDALLESLCFLGNCGRRRADITEESPIVSLKSP